MSSLDQLSAADLSQLDQGGKLWHLYRQAFADSLYFACKHVLSSLPVEGNKMNPVLHQAQCLALEEFYLGSIDRLLIEAPRKHLKSTISTENSPTWYLGWKVVNGQDPNTRFGITSYKVTLAQRFWGTNKKIFERNELFRFLFPELIPVISDEVRWNQEQGTVPRLWQPKEPTFDCYGRGTGFAYDIVLIDDLINEENWDSADAIEKATFTVTAAEQLIDRGRSGRGKIGLFENPWTMNDVNHHVHMERLDYAVFSVGCFGPRLAERMPITAQKYSRGLPESCMELMRKMPEGEPIWPEVFSKEELGRIMLAVKPKVWSAQYLCDPADPEAVDFKAEWIKSAELVFRGKNQDVPTIKFPFEDEMPPEVPLADCNLYIVWDPALETKNSPDRNAVLVTLVDAWNRKVVFRDYAKKEDPLVSMETFLTFAKTYKGYLKACGVEEVLFQKVLKGLLERAADDRGIALPLRKIRTPTSKMAKEQRIRAWVGTLFQDGQIYVLPRCNNFIKEYSYFGTGGFTVDLMDAFAYSTRMWTKPSKPSEIEEEQERQEMINHSLGMTGYGSALELGTTTL